MTPTSTTLLLAAPVALPAFAGAAYAVLGWRRGTAWLGAVAAAGLLGAAIAVSALAIQQPRSGLGGLLRADALSAVMLIVIGTVAFLAMTASPAYLAVEDTDPRAARRYGILTQGFIASMALAVLAASLGVLWVAVEATTIMTAFLVGHTRSRNATEAAWKYVVICSTGIALAFLGIVLTHYAAVHAHAPATDALDWAALTAHAGELDPGVMRIAVALLVLGFGTKAGLAPMHAWLPDAHSQAPAPVSALMSGVLLSVAFYAILRVKTIADPALGTGFMRTLLIAVGLLSLAVAAALLLGQRDYKRMLAYSSIEHMGLLALGAAIGTPLALTAVLLHILGHGLAKTVAFLGAGHIHQLVGSNRISVIRGLGARAPLLAGAFAAGLLALLGFPPFSLFASELGIARAGFNAGLGWTVLVALALMLVIVAAVASRSALMVLGTPRTGPGAATAPRSPSMSLAAALIGGLIACAALGVTTWPLNSLLDTAAAIVGAQP